jgi:putative endonuclease
MWYTYIIQSLVDGSYYIGSTHDVLLRLERHNTGWTKSTKGEQPWKLVYTEKYTTKSEALKHERKIKSWKSRKMIEQLIKSGS